jgi:PEGA domain
VPSTSRFLVTALSTGLVALVALAGAPRAARADEPAADPKRAEARARFDRGMALLKEHDDAGALAEFQLAHDLVPAPQTLLMIGVLDATLNRPVEAVRILDRVIGDPGTLSPQQLAAAQKHRDEEARKVGTLTVTTSAPAMIEIDGVDAAKTPTDKPIPVAAGPHLVAALATGYLPTRREITIAGGVTSALAFELVPSEQRAAHLFVRTNLVDADVVVDGERVARTPLPGSITIQPGNRLVELRRAGYGTASSKVTLGDGATAELSFAPAEVAGGDVRRGTLSLDASEPEAELVVDGASRGVYRAPVPLPAGRHLVRVVRGGFLPSERILAIPENADARARVTLTPTPETRDAYVAHARAVRKWGWIAAAGGVALGAAGGIYAATLAPKLDRARQDRDALYATFTPGGACDSAGPNKLACEAQLNAANDLADARALKVNVGVAVAGVGLAAALTGAYLLLTGDDPARYDVPSSEGAATPQLGFTPAVDGRGGVFAFAGRF